MRCSTPPACWYRPRSPRYASETALDYRRGQDSVDRDASGGSGGHRHRVFEAHGHEGSRQSDFELDRQPTAEQQRAQELLKVRLEDKKLRSSPCINVG